MEVADKHHLDRGLPVSQRASTFLFYSGWLIALLYFPNGLLHQVLGVAVYARDGLLVLHLVATLIVFARSGRLRSILGNIWPLLLVPVFMLPALFNAKYALEALTALKWAAMWLDWILLGRLLAMQRTITSPMWILAGITAALLAVDAAAGCYEWRTGRYLFPMRGVLSPLGVPLGKDSLLQHHLRLKGLQRDVFSFSNLMGSGCVLGLGLFISLKNAVNRSIALVVSGLFALLVFASGGRSALIGVFTVGLFAGAFALARRQMRYYSGYIVLAWLCMAFAVSLLGVGEITEKVGTSIMAGSYVGDPTTAYGRDANWGNILTAIGRVPIVLFTGSPLGSYLDSKVAMIYHWADNNYLWLIYHTSIIGLLGVIVYFRSVLAYWLPSSRVWARDCCVLFLVFVMGESIAREALMFIGCMPLFVACGFLSGSRSRTGKSKPEGRSRLSRLVSDGPRHKRHRRRRVEQLTSATIDAESSRHD